MSWQAKGAGGGWSGGQSGSSAGSQVTPLAKALLIGLASCYVVRLLLVYWLALGKLLTTLPLQAIPSPGFRPWQLLTYPLYIDTDPVNFLFLLMTFYFFAPPAERYMGTGRFVTFLLLLVLIPGVVGALVSPLLWGVPTPPFAGVWAISAALVAAFGWIHPRSTVMFNFLLPVPGIFFTYFTIAIAVLLVLGRNPLGVFQLAAIGVTYAVVQRGVRVPDLRRQFLLLKQRRVQKKLTKLQVIQGGKTGPKDGSNGDPRKPTVH